MTRNDIDIVRDFCASWATHDINAITAWLADDCEWENVPLGHVVGRAAIRAKLEAVLRRSTRLEWRVLAIAATADGGVLTERIDYVHVDDRRIELRLMGVFRLREGLIHVWRDYFDLVDYRRQMQGIVW